MISVGSSGQPASGYNDLPSVSADGRYVAFTSNAADIIGFPAQTQPQVFVRDRVAGVTKLVTDTPGQPMIPTGIGVGEPDISPDGTQIALSEQDQFENSQVWVARSTSGYFDAAVFDLVSYGVSGAPVPNGASNPSMSSTGRLVAFASRANTELSGGTVSGCYQVWMRSRPIQLGSTPAISFGTVDIGSQSPPQNAVITNTSGAEINIGSVSSPAAPFAITSNRMRRRVAVGCIVRRDVGVQADGGGPGQLVVGRHG